MDDTEGTPVRKTRSSTTKVTPTATKREKPGPLSRKTRKKVVLMEVEVSDEEGDETVQEKSEATENTEDTKKEGKETDDEKVNGSNENKDAESEVVLNDDVIFHDDETEIDQKDAGKMEVDRDTESKKTKPQSVKEKDETSPSASVETQESNGVSQSQSEEPAKKKLRMEEKPNTAEDVDTKAKKDPVEKTTDVKKEEEMKSDEPKGKESENIEESKAKIEEEKTEIKDIENKNKTVEVEDTENRKESTGSGEKEKVEETKIDKKNKNESAEIEEKDDSKNKDKPAKTEEKEVQDQTVKNDDEGNKDESTENKETEKKDKTVKVEDKETKNVESKEKKLLDKQKADPDAENISEDELPAVQAVKVPEAEEVSDEELPGPKRAELPADTEVVSEDELPSVKTETKKDSNKRKLNATDYDPCSPTSENEAPTKKISLDTAAEKEKEEKPKPKKLPELDKYWKAVNDDPTDFTGWTYLLQYVDQENDVEAAREAYDAFLSHYPYCYGYWRKYADYQKRKGNKKKCEEVFERGLKAIPLSVDLWIHYLTYVKLTRTDDEEYIRSQFERALLACGLEFRSDRLWDSYIKWETEGKRLQKVTAIYDRLLGTPTQGYTTHFENFQEHVSNNAPNKVIDVDEFLALRKEVRQQLKHEVSSDAPPADNDAPPGDDDQNKVISSDEETKALRERIILIRKKLHKNTVTAVTARWNYEEAIKRPYFHVKPLERCQLKNWQDYLDYETEQGDRVRIIVLFERCLIACALYEEFWLKFVHYLENLKDHELQPKIRDVYERACTIHHLKKPNLHLQWAMFEEGVGNASRAAEILVNLEKSVPNLLQIAYRRINLERRRGDHEKCCQLFEYYINQAKNKVIASSISIKYARLTLFLLKNVAKAQEILESAIVKDPNNPRLYLQLVDITLHKVGTTEKDIISVLNTFLDRDTADPDQKMLFAQRKLEFLEDFGSNLQVVQEAHEQYQKLVKQNKDAIKKKEIKSDTTGTTSKSKETKQTPQSSQGNSGNYNNPYGAQPNQASYPPYSGSQQGPNYYAQYGQGDQYQYQNWQYPQGGYGGYNQWGGYGSGYGY